MSCAYEPKKLNENISALAQDHLKLIRIQEQSKRKLESEIDEFKIENNKQKKQIGYLERERDRLAEEELDLTNKIESLMDDIRYKKVRTFKFSRLDLQLGLF